MRERTMYPLMNTLNKIGDNNDYPKYSQSYYYTIRINYRVGINHGI